jgi:hypothetical protein
MSDKTPGRMINERAAADVVGLSVDTLRRDRRAADGAYSLPEVRYRAPRDYPLRSERLGTVPRRETGGINAKRPPGVVLEGRA